PASAIRSICTNVLDLSTDATGQLVNVLDKYRSVHYQFGMTPILVQLCEALLLRGQFDAALEAIERGLSGCDLNGERLLEAELHRLKAEVLLLDKKPNVIVHAQSLLDKALTIARSQGELRAAMSLARLWRDQGKVPQARELLAPVYGWFTEEFDTRDL